LGPIRRIGALAALALALVALSACGLRAADVAGVPEARVDGCVEGDRVRWGVVREGLRAPTFEGYAGGDRPEGAYSMITTRVGRWEARRLARTAPWRFAAGAAREDGQPWGI